VSVGVYGGAGDLIAVGTPSHPITFTPLYPGYNWGSITFSRTYEGIGFSSTISRLSYVNLDHGGDPTETQFAIQNCHDPKPASPNSTGMVVFDVAKGAYEGPAIDHTSFAHSDTDAIRAVAKAQAHITTSYTDPALGNNFTDIAGTNDWPATPCP
jgi:hypothetical protein